MLLLSLPLFVTSQTPVCLQTLLMHDGMLRRAMSQPAAISSDAADGLPSQKASSQPISSSSPPHRKFASMRCGIEPQDQPMKLQNSTSVRRSRLS